MSKINGTLVLFQLGATPSTLAHVENSSINISVDLPENTDKDSEGFREILEEAGVKQASISVDGYADFSFADGNAKELIDTVLDRKNVGFAFGPEGSGSFQITGSCRSSDAELGAPNEDSATISGTFETTGKFEVEENI